MNRISCALACLAMSLAATAWGQARKWTAAGFENLEGSCLGLAEGKAIIKAGDGKETQVPFDKFGPEDQKAVLDVELGPLPLSSPAWLPGYKIRFPVRIIDDLIASNQTAIVRIPTGGWLKPDASDLAVLTRSGKRIPVAILSHDPMGDTLCQFRRNGMERWYWVYIANPEAPDRDRELEARIKQAKQTSEQALLLKMAAMKRSADRAAELRDVSALVDKEKDLISQSVKELAQWEKMIPEREVAARDAATKVPPLKAEAEKAAAANAPFEKDANDKTATARTLEREAAELRAKANQLNTDHDTTARNLEASQAALKQADDAVAKAQASGAAVEAVNQLKAQRDAAAKASQEQAAVLARLKNEKAGADGTATAKEKAAVAAGERAQAARLAAAPTTTAKANADAAFAQAAAASQAADQALAAGKARVVEVTKIKGEAETRLVALMPKFEPLKRAAEDAAREAEQATADATTREKFYFDTAFEADPRLFKEGLTVEFREWKGDKLSSWPAVVDGLQKSDNVIGASVIGELLQNVNPFRRSDPRNFAASYRGYLKVDQPGIYSFFINGDDASFLFINGYLVYSRPGSNAPLRGKVPLYSVGADIQLDVGIHPFEIHHIVGNTPDASGLCTLSWLTPGSKQWAFIPRTSFVQSLTAVPAGMESFDGKPAAVFDAGVSDTLASDGISMYLVRFEAQGTAPDLKAVRWDFGDSAAATGPSAYHVFFDASTYEVKLTSHGSLPPFRRRYQPWVPPIPTCPASLELAIRSFEKVDLARLDISRLNDLFHFLLICEQPSRWPLMERVCRQIMKNPRLDLRYRAGLYASLMKSLAEQGKAKEALALLDTSLKEIGNYRTLQILLNLNAANIQRDYLRDYQAADPLYASILGNNLRLRHPLVRQAAVEWGDMALDAGDQSKASTAYRAAMSLGGVGASGETQGDAVERGALLRMAEQQLRTGNIRQTRRLLERIETEFPEQKLEGLYRFLRGDAERSAGRYDVAIRNYEILLQLPQWAGYHALARYGIADCYYRMSELTNSIGWLADLESREPAIYQERGLDLNNRIKARLTAMQAVTGSKAPVFSFFENALEPGQPLPDPAVPYARVMPGLGFHGPNSAWLNTRNGATQFFSVPFGTMSNLPPQGTLWIELWYRDILSIPGGDNTRHVRADITTDAGEAVAAVTMLLERTFGQWHKAGMLVNVPRTLNGKGSVAIYDTGGYLEIDAVSVRHISDTSLEGLTRFLEGADPQ